MSNENYITLNHLIAVEKSINAKIETLKNSLSPIAFSNSYTDLENKPQESDISYLTDFFTAGRNTHTSGEMSLQGRGGNTYDSSSIAKGSYSLSLPGTNITSGPYSFAQGYGNRTITYFSHAEGYNTTAGFLAINSTLNQSSNSSCHSEGYSTWAIGSYSHCEGAGSLSYGQYSHAEGNTDSQNGLQIKISGNKNSQNYTATKDRYTTAWSPLYTKGIIFTTGKQTGSYPSYEPRAALINSITYTNNSISSLTTNSTLNDVDDIDDDYAYLKITGTFGTASHTEGYATTAYGNYQHVAGKYNIPDSTSAEIIGNGTSLNALSNARTLDWNGNEVLAGKLTVGAGPTNNMDVATKQYVDTATAGITSDLSGLTDTTISSPADGQILTYDSTTSKWVNTTFTSLTVADVNTLIASALAEYGDGDTASYGYNDGNEVNY